MVRSATKVTEEVLEKLPGLKIIARAGVGVDNIDVAAATKRGILVVNAPEGNTISTAEHLGYDDVFTAKYTASKPIFKDR
jgi:D-3-phosphoglycerate dehydrogenase